VLVLTADYGANVWSGIGTAVSYQVAALASRGHDVHVSAPARADVIHLHSLTLADAALRLKQQFGIPLVYTAHSLLRVELGGRPGACAWIQRQQMLFETADHVCFVSRCERGRALQQMPSLAQRSSVVPNGVPDAAAGSHGGRPNGPIIFAGRFTRNKGADIIARMAPLVLERAPARQFILAGGHGDEFETSSLHRLAARYPQQCRLAGWLPRDELHRLFAEASLVVIPSRYEPFGMIALEAMSLGVPVLACASGGLAEIIQPDAGGKLIHSLLPEKWAGACLELFDDDHGWKRLSLQGPRWVSSQFHVNLTAARLEAILTGIVRPSHEFRNN